MVLLEGYQQISYSEFLQHFVSTFGQENTPIGLCRVPGRINLIGEHIDYCGFPVLPVSIQQEILLAYTPRKDCKIYLKNISPAFEDSFFENRMSISPSPVGAWENYCKAAIQAINTKFPSDHLPGMNLLIGSNLSIGAGLASSSALVVGCALAYLDVRGIVLEKDISRLELAQLMAEGEHYVGTCGGGMDQTVILCSREAHACKVYFYPLKTQDIPLFSDFVFVASHSLVKAEKTRTALNRYNAGPLACRILTAFIEAAIEKEFGINMPLKRLSELWYGNLCLTFEEAEKFILTALEKNTYSFDELDMILQQKPASWKKSVFDPKIFPNKVVPLKSRAQHVISEFRRVEEATDLILANEPENFGKLMNASHESCAQDYEVSCPELDELVSIARTVGAVGSRLTGAGFGGYAISLVPKSLLSKFQQSLTALYYIPKGVPEREVHHYLWAVRANSAASYVQHVH